MNKRNSASEGNTMESNKAKAKKQTKLRCRIRGADREEFYLELAEASTISVCNAQGNILGNIRGLPNGCIGFLPHNADGWTIVNPHKSETKTGLILGTPVADEFIKEVV
jgi:hypothetical protein